MSVSVTDVPLPGFADLDVHDTVRAARIVIRCGLGTCLLLQDRMHYGLARIRQLMDQLTDLGVLSPPVYGRGFWCARRVLVSLDRMAEAEDAVRAGRRITP